MIREQKYKKTPFSKAIENILADREEWKNKYDALVEKIKEKLNEEKLPLVIVGGRRNSKTLNYGIKLGRKQALQELIPEEE